MMPKYGSVLSFPKLSMKHLVWFFIFISCSILFQMWYLYFKLKPPEIRPVMLRKDPSYINVLHYDYKEGSYYLPAKCPVMQKCVFTHLSEIAPDEAIFFDAIVFKEDILTSLNRPENRSGKQLYIFHSTEPSTHHLACASVNDDFFNLTFTYRLDSDIVAQPFEFLDKEKNVIAPNKNAKWETSNAPVASEIKIVLGQKTLPVVWIVDDAKEDKMRAEFIGKLRRHLREIGDIIMDVREVNPNDTSRNTRWVTSVMKDYFFYMAYEDVLAKDYISYKPLFALTNYAIPIVYGAANYSSFLPPGSYIDANITKTEDIAKLIKEAISNPEVYETYFKWRNLYKLNIKSGDLEGLCDICKALNGEKAKQAPAKKNFRLWWNTPEGMKLCSEKVQENVTQANGTAL